MAAVWGALFSSSAALKKARLRCYLQYTLTRGINFWWAAIVAVCGLCLTRPSARAKARGASTSLRFSGFFPADCCIVEQGAEFGFWQAAWTTSTAFGFVPHRQQRGKLDRHLRCSAHRLRLLCERAASQVGMVGHRLPRRMGLGGNLFLRHCRQRHSRAPPFAQHHHPSAIRCGAEAPTARKAACWSCPSFCSFSRCCSSSIGRREALRNSACTLLHHGRQLASSGETHAASSVARKIRNHAASFDAESSR